MTGIVYKSTGSWYSVKSQDGQIYQCRLKGKFRIKGIKNTNPIAVGDLVDFELENNTKGIIYHFHERKNYIIRKSVNLAKETHVIAANIDQVFLLVTLNNPPTYTSFIDRFLVTAKAYQIKAILIFNKYDTYNQELLSEAESLSKIYKKIGYTCIAISAIKKTNIDSVKAMMIGKTSLFSGHSGVGKSTLVNAISPQLKLRTAQLSEQHKLGQHTTTFAQMFDLDFNARIIDTPGIKGFGLVNIEKTELTDYFPEFFQLKNNCKFNNCLHIEEPNCAVKKAVEQKEIAYSRYQSYQQMIADKDENFRIDNYG